MASVAVGQKLPKSRIYGFLQSEFILILPRRILSKIINSISLSLFPSVDVSVGLSKFEMSKCALLKFWVKIAKARLAFKEI